MTREALIKHWDVIQAFKEGKEIEYNSGEGWTKCNNLQIYLFTEYRVKPESEFELTLTEALIIMHRGWVGEADKKLYDKAHDILLKKYKELFHKFITQ